MAAARLLGSRTCQAPSPGFSKWPFGGSSGFGGPGGMTNCLFVEAATVHGGEMSLVMLSVTAVILLFFPVPLSAIKSHDSLWGGLRGAQL